MALVLARGALAQDLVDLPADLPSRYGVVGVRAEVAGDTLRIVRVKLHSPAQQAGLRAGDLIAGSPPYRLRTADELARLVGSHAPGSSVEFLILREGQPLLVTCAVTDLRSLYYLMGEQGRPPPPEGDRHRRWRQQPDPLAMDAADLIRESGAGGVLDSLQAAFRGELGRYASDGRLADVQFALTEPLQAAAPGRALAAEMLSAPSLVARLRSAAAHLDLELPPQGDGAAAADTVFAALVGTPLHDVLLASVARAGSLAGSAFADLSAAEREDLLSGAAPLLEQFDRTFYLDLGDSAGTEAHMRTLRLAKRVRLPGLVAAGLALAELAAEPRLKQLARQARRLSGPLPATLPQAFDGRFLLAAETPWGWVLVGDEGPNHYGADAAVIVDLGGDDTYLGDGGAAHLDRRRAEGDGPDRVRQRSPVGVVIDLAGDDRYIGSRAGSLGAGLGGAGLLVDRRGDDLYSGDVLTQGSAFCGVGLLVDGDGDDVYLARQAAQGAAFFGLGMLVDEAGNDLLCAAQFAQGFGGASGLGALCDLRGGDRYVADGVVPSGYGTDGVYNGWSQGVGCGFRGYTAGGIGLLADGAGDDDYQAGDFSQGTGYFFGLGVLADRSGRDRYRGTRYSQAAGAHQAVGVLLDGGGQDVYRGTVAANQGGAWDAAIAILEDAGGDDRYDGAGLSQGAAAMNGFGLLVDRAGADDYRSASGQGQGGDTRYWGGRDALNLGLLIDGDGTDSYDQKGRADGLVVRDGRVGLFADR